MQASICDESHAHLQHTHKRSVGRGVSCDDGLPCCQFYTALIVDAFCLESPSCSLVMVKRSSPALEGQVLTDEWCSDTGGLFVGRVAATALMQGLVRIGQSSLRRVRPLYQRGCHLHLPPSLVFNVIGICRLQIKAMPYALRDHLPAKRWAVSLQNVSADFLRNHHHKVCYAVDRARCSQFSSGRGNGSR